MCRRVGEEDEPGWVVVSVGQDCRKKVSGDREGKVVVQASARLPWHQVKVASGDIRDPFALTGERLLLLGRDKK